MKLLDKAIKRGLENISQTNGVPTVETQGPRGRVSDLPVVDRLSQTQVEQGGAANRLHRKPKTSPDQDIPRHVLYNVELKGSGTHTMHIWIWL